MTLFYINYFEYRNEKIAFCFFLNVFTYKRETRLYLYRLLLT